MKSEEFLPVLGALPQPQSIHEGALALARERILLPELQSCEFRCDEFTSLCPRTGQPDFGIVRVYYQPLVYGLESKSLKHYLWAFRNEGLFCEHLAARIADDILHAINPWILVVTVEQNRRGGISLVTKAKRYGVGGNQE